MATAADVVKDLPNEAMAQQLESGIATGILLSHVLPGEQHGPLPGRISLTFSSELESQPNVVRFAAIRDPKLRAVKAIPLDVSREESHFVVSWSEINEFGTGATLSAALDDFEASLRELYHELFSPDAHLGPDMEKVKQTLAEHINPRK
jgi:hypothetical protein